MKEMVAVGVAAALVFTGVSSAADKLPSCDAPQIQREVGDWEFARDSQLGLIARDATAHFIGPYANRTKESGNPGAWGGRNWFPNDVVRHTYCGIPQKFTVFNAPGRERDFHPFLLPTKGFEYIRDEAALRGPIEPDGAVYGEITLPKSLEGAWFGKVHRPLVFTNDAVQFNSPGGFCVYGPWVVEEFHDDKPEIHPAAQMWYRDDAGLHWVVAQDDSDRFGNKGGRANYCPVEGPGTACEERMPPAYANWWTNWSLQVQARVPFEHAAGQPGEHSVAGEFRAPRPFDTARDFTVGAESNLRVSYTKDPDLLVSVSEICQSEAGVRGYVDIRATVNSRSPIAEGEGMQRIRISGPAFHASELKLGAPYSVVSRDRPSGSQEPVLSARIRDEEPERRRHRGGWTYHEFDVQATYTGEGDAEKAAERLNRLLGRLSPDDDEIGGILHPENLEDLYRREIDAGLRPYGIRARAEWGSDGRAELLPKCSSNPPTDGLLSLCLASNAIPVFDESREVADLGIWVKDGFTGSVRLIAEISEPPGRVGSGAVASWVAGERSISFPLTATAHQEAFNGMLQEVVKSAGLSEAELERLWTFSGLGATVRTDCGVAARRARMLRLTMLAASRDADVTGFERERIIAIGHSVAGALREPEKCTAGRP